MAAEENKGILEQLAQSIISLGLFGRPVRKNGKFHSSPASQSSECFLEVDPVFFHDELEDISALVAFAKTTPGAGIRPDDECRCALIRMEGTKSGVVTTGFPQLHTAFADQVNNIEAGFYFIRCRHKLPVTRYPFSVSK